MLLNIPVQSHVLRIVAFIRPHKLEEVKTALSAKGVTGLTVTECRGCGSSPETTEWFQGESYVISLPPRIKLETVVTEDMKEVAIEAILKSARTGRAGDGKIFVLPELDAVRIRTGERGEIAL